MSRERMSLMLANALIAVSPSIPLYVLMKTLPFCSSLKAYSTWLRSCAAPARCSGRPTNLTPYAKHTKPLTTVTLHIPVHTYSAITHCVRTDVGSLSSCSGEPLKAVAHLLEVLILPLSLHLLCIALLLLLYCSFPLSSFFMCLSPSPFALLRTRPVPSPPPARSNTEGCPSELSDGAVICIHRALP